MKNIIDGKFLAKLETLDLNIKKKLDGSFGGNRRSSAYGSSAEFADFREYVPGDDLRRIDWNIYGRFEKLVVKLYVDERQLHHRIYIDSSASMDWGEPSKAYTALRIAAALGFISVQAMDRVSFYSLNGSSCDAVSRTVVGKDAFYNAANALNGIEFCGETDLGAAIEACETPGYGDGISFIISDFLTDSDWMQAVDHLLYRKRGAVLIQVLSRDEASPGFDGKLQLLDSESEGEEDAKNMKTEVTRSSVKAYSEAFAYHENMIARFCASRNIDLLTVFSDESIEKILFGKAHGAGVVK